MICHGKAKVGFLLLIRLETDATFSCFILTLRKGKKHFPVLAWVEKQPPWLLKPEVHINRIQVNFVLISLGFRKTLTCLIYEMWKSKAFTEHVAPWLISCSGQFPVSQPEDRGICFAGIMTFHYVLSYSVDQCCGETT